MTAIKEWAWNAGTSPTYPTTPDRETDIGYVTSYGNLIALPSSITVNGAGTMLAQTKYSYDNSSQLAAVSNVTHHDDTNFSISNTVRGNPTQIQRWVSGSGTSAVYLNTNLSYDTTGLVTKVVDPASNATTLQYGDGNFYSDNGSNPPAAFSPTVTTNAYVTQVSLPIAGTRTFGYYYNTGKRALAKDGNSADSYAHFLDSLDRPTHTYGPQISQLSNNRAWSMRTYAGQTQVDAYSTRDDTSPSTSCSACVHRQVIKDGLKRKTQSVLVSDPEKAVNRDFTYDSVGRWQSYSNPYRSTSDPTYGTSQPSYDALSRATGITLPDGNVTHVYYGSNVTTSVGGITAQLCSSSTYGLGYPVLSVDPAGKKRQVWKDGFGRLIEVDEPDPSSGSLTLNTCYAHDAVGNLTSIVQGSQTRSFVHDGVSRLTSRTLPESGTTSFSYTTSTGALCAGSAHAVCSKTDARGIKTTYAYDALSRLTTKSYSDSTPTVTYMYDQTSFNGLTITSGVGRLTGIKETSGSTVIGQTAWTYDAAGRILTEQKSIGSVTKSISYAYALGGQLKSVTYPSGHTVSYTYGNAGRALSAVDTTSNINYVTSATFAPHGKLSTAVYGQVTSGFAGITRTRAYNNRLQTTGVKDASSNGTVKDISYTYDQGSGVNNGQVMQMIDNAVAGRTQTYTYDQMRRLLTAKTQATSGSDCWGQSLTRDRYGNLGTVAVTQCSAPSLSATISTTTNQNSAYHYDVAGNVTNDGTNAYTWDAEHRVASGAGVTYTYDGLGRRVQKSTGQLYWYDAKGHLLAQTDSSGNLVYEYVYFGGRKVACRDANSNVYFYSSDKSGTVRAMTNSTGVVQQMSDYYPTGCEHVIVSSTENQFKLNGSMQDTETGTLASKGTYQPTTATVLSGNQTGSTGGNPQALNPYANINFNDMYSSANMEAGIAANAVSAGMSFAGGGGSGGDDVCYDMTDGSTSCGSGDGGGDSSGNVAAPSNNSDAPSDEASQPAGSYTGTDLGNATNNGPEDSNATIVVNTAQPGVSATVYNGNVYDNSTGSLISNDAQQYMQGGPNDPPLISEDGIIFAVVGAGVGLADTAVGMLDTGAASLDMSVAGGSSSGSYVFYSGQGAYEAASEWAAANNGIMIQDTVWGDLGAQTGDWSTASQGFASEASGPVQFFGNDPFLPNNSFWFNDELPTLGDNPNVTGLTINFIGPKP